MGLTDDLLQGSADGSYLSEPHVSAQKVDMTQRLAQVIEGLPKNERMVLSLYYEHDLNLKEIGDVLGVSESRISQLHSQATHRIKARL